MKIPKIPTNINEQFVVIVLFFLALFSLDSSGIMNLYGHNYVRRILNMSRRRDSLNHKDKLKPFACFKKQFLKKTEVNSLQSMKLVPDKSDIYGFTRTNTSTLKCCKTFNENERKIVKDIIKKSKQLFEQEIGKQLYQFKNDHESFYTYHGKDSKHLWHVDPRNVDTIYNIIICVKRSGNISPFQYKDKENEVISFDTHPGDAILFQGGVTEHQVPPNNDDSSERTVFSMSFTSDRKLSRMDLKSMCTFIEGGNNKKNILLLILATFLINVVISHLVNLHKLDYSVMLGVWLVSVILSKYVPFLNVKNLGSGRPTSIQQSLFLTLGLMLTTLSIKGGALFYLYCALSDTFFHYNWVGYD